MSGLNEQISHTIRNLSKKFPDIDPFDWFIVGVLYNHQKIPGSVDDIFTRVKAVSDLKRVAHLEPEEKDGYLIRMAEKEMLTTAKNPAPVIKQEVQSEKPVKTSVSKQNDIKIEQHKANEIKVEETKINTSAIEPKKVGNSQNKARNSDEEEVLSDLSYNSDVDNHSNSVRRTTVVKKKTKESVYESPKVEVKVQTVFNNIKPKADQRMVPEDEEKLSVALAKKIEEEEAILRERSAERRRQQQEEESPCDICLKPLYNDEWQPLSNCTHMFHNACLRQHLKSELDLKNLPLTCPSSKCAHEIAQQDLREILESEDIKRFHNLSFQKYLDSHADEVSCCPTLNCPFVFVKEDGQRDFQCQICKKSYCLECRSEAHKGKTCNEHKAPKMRDGDEQKFDKGKKYKQCSKCKYWVDKKPGDDHMICKCGAEFCYWCGGKFMHCECFDKVKEDMQRRYEAARLKKAANKRRKQ